MDRRDAIKSLSLAFGYTLTPAAIASLATSCSSGSVSTDWVPTFFTTEEAFVVQELGEVILPATAGAPGAKDVKAHLFGDVFLADASSDEDRAKCKEGARVWMEWFENKFTKLSNAKPEDFEKSMAMLMNIDDAKQAEIQKLTRSSEVPSDPEKRETYYLYSFIFTVKHFTMFGYYASEKVGEEILSYDPIPGKYIACMPASEVGNAWSL